MKKLVKFICVLLCLLLCTSVLLSAGYTVHGHSHECLGNDCQICRIVFLQKELLRLTLTSFFVGAFAVIFIQLLYFVNSLGGKSKRQMSLVANKVKLTA